MIGDIQDAVGKRLAELLKCEAAMVTAGCASAMQYATVAVIAGRDQAKLRQLPDTTGMKNEVLVQRSHRVGYDHAIRNSGAKIIEVDGREELEKAINDKTALMFYLNSSTGSGKIKHEEFVEIAQKHKIPTLIDAAADVPPVDNLFRFTKLGFDLVAFSGGKGIRGPQSAGLLLGKKEFIDAAKASAPPNGDTPSRTNKVNKEEMIGMLVALEAFLARDHAAVWKDWEARCQKISDALKGWDDIKTVVNVPEIANAVPHLRITWEPAKHKGLTSGQMVTQLREGTPSIELAPGGGGGGGRRGGGAQPQPGATAGITVGVWMMEPGEDAIVAERIKTILKV
jgi:L-seryl-tRNA(Ser) seleniumtransferase